MSSMGGEEVLDEQQLIDEDVPAAIDSDKETEKPRPESDGSFTQTTQLIEQMTTRLETDALTPSSTFGSLHFYE